MTHFRGVFSVGALLGLALLTTGCQRAEIPAPLIVEASPVAEDGDVAVWQLGDAVEIAADTAEFDVEVTRLRCSGGITGEVLDPVVSYEAAQIVVRFDAAPIGDGIFACPANDAVLMVVRLDEPVGQRELVDGGCLRPDTPTNVFCETATRWPAG